MIGVRLIIFNELLISRMCVTVEVILLNKVLSAVSIGFLGINFETGESIIVPKSFSLLCMFA